MSSYKTPLLPRQLNLHDQSVYGSNLIRRMNCLLPAVHVDVCRPSSLNWITLRKNTDIAASKTVISMLLT